MKITTGVRAPSPLIVVISIILFTICILSATVLKEYMKIANAGAESCIAKFISSRTHSVPANNIFGLPPRMSLLYVVYHDTDMVLAVLSRVAHLISEIVVIDGPRKSTIPWLEAAGLLYSEGTSPVKRFFFMNVASKYPGISISYFYKVWEHEADQRNFGFHACSQPVMMQMEGDMLVNIAPNALRAFLLDREKIVTGVLVMNMVNTEHALGSAGFNAPQHFFPMIVKRNKMTAETYFSHIWIVGLAKHRHPPNQSELFPPIGYGYHLTLLRSLDNMFVKYAFYRSLNWEDRNQTLEYKRQVNLTTAIAQRFGFNVARLVMARAFVPSALCAPADDTALVVPPIFNDELAHQASQHELNSLCDYRFLTDILYVADGEISWVQIPAGRENASYVSFESADIVSCNVSVRDWGLNKLPKYQGPFVLQLQGKSTRLRLPQLSADTVCIGRALGFLCQLNTGYLVAKLHPKLT